MSRGALALMLLTWTVILFVTVRLFLKVLRTPDRDNGP
jgi:hypothetical protein